MGRGARVSRSVPLTAAGAVLVTAVALAGSWQLRVPDRGRSAATPPASAGHADACVDTACPRVAAAAVPGGRVALHAGRGGAAGALAVPGAEPRQRVTITDIGARLDGDSLDCVAGGSTACLVTGDSPQGRIGEVFVRRHGGWDRVQRPYVSSAGSLGLRPVDGRLSVVAVQRACADADCADDSAYAQVFTAGGADLGCTEVYASKYSLPGWPDVAPAGYQLGDCPSR